MRSHLTNHCKRVWNRFDCVLSVNSETEICNKSERMVDDNRWFPFRWVSRCLSTIHNDRHWKGLRWALNSLQPLFRFIPSIQWLILRVNLFYGKQITDNGFKSLTKWSVTRIVPNLNDTISRYLSLSCLCELRSDEKMKFRVRDKQDMALSLWSDAWVRH